MQYSKINQLREGQKNVFIKEADVVETSEIIKANIKGKEVEIVDGIIKDEMGQIKISAFGFASKFLREAKKIKVENCYCKGYNGELQISTGFFGRIVKIV